MAFQKILVPIDFSSCSDHALERAVEMAKLTQGALHLLHAYSSPIAFELDVPLPPEVFDQLRDAAKRTLAERVERAAASGLRVEGQVVADSPAHAILEAAEKIRPDLIVMGTHGRTGMKHVLLGSVAERTVRLAPCPVMTVKPPPSAG